MTFNNQIDVIASAIATKDLDTLTLSTLNQWRQTHVLGMKKKRSNRTVLNEICLVDRNGINRKKELVGVMSLRGLKWSNKLNY